MVKRCRQSSSQPQPLQPLKHLKETVEVLTQTQDRLMALCALLYGSLKRKGFRAELEAGTVYLLEYAVKDHAQAHDELNTIRGWLNLPQHTIKGLAATELKHLHAEDWLRRQLGGLGNPPLSG